MRDLDEEVQIAISHLRLKDLFMSKAVLTADMQI